MNLSETRKKVAENLKEFNNNIPKKKTIMSRKQTVNKEVLPEKTSYIKSFFDKGLLIKPMTIDKGSISTYKDIIESVKQFPEEFRPDDMLESEILSKTNGSRNTRRILLDSVREEEQGIMGNYDNMVAYYLLLGGDKPVERFSRVEMSMKQYGVRPDIGVAIMKYGDKITTKLEELAKQGKKSPQEWEVFKDQVLHSFSVAEKIGNRNVNLQEHEMWEERLVRLGILERKLEKPNQQTLRDAVKVDVGKPSDKSPDKPSDRDQQGILRDSTMQQRAQRAYENTGAIPLGYKLGEDGKTVVSIASQIKFEQNGTNSKNKLSSAVKKQTMR